MDTISLTRDIVTDYAIEGATGRMFEITRTRYLDDAGSVISEQVHRRPIEPDADIRDESEEVRALADVVRTPERLDRYEQTRPPREPVEEPPR